MSDIARMLRQRREAVGLSQYELADALATTQSAVSELESSVTDPRLSTIARWADSLGLKIELATKEASAEAEARGYAKALARIRQMPQTLFTPRQMIEMLEATTWELP